MENTGTHDKPIGHLNNPSGDVVKVARELLDKLRQDTTAAQLHAEELRQELEVERAKTVNERLADADKLIDALKAIADHHCANLHPEFIRDMPADEFAAAAQLVDKVVGATQRDSERAAIWSERAGLVHDWRDRRGTTEWQVRVAEYKEKQLIAQASAAGYAIVPIDRSGSASMTAVRNFAKLEGYKLVKASKPAKRKAKAKRGASRTRRARARK